MRWSEEVLLLREEMHRVLTFFCWHARWWEEQASRIPNLSVEDAEGAAAYVARQSHIRLSMAHSFDALWRSGWKGIGQGVSADNEILELEEEAAPFITSYPSVSLDLSSTASSL